MKYFKHLKTILKHKYYVFIECFKIGIPIQGILHDLSKLRPSEFISSSKYWTGIGSPVESERNVIGYSLAWRYHKGRNKHHWQWWVDIDGWDENNNPKLNPAPMPIKYIKEMYCDMIAAAKAYGIKDGKKGARDYYEKWKKEWVLHKETEEIFLKMLYGL